MQENAFYKSIKNREILEECNLDRTPEQNGCGRLHSLAHAYTNVQEVQLFNLNATIYKFIITLLFLPLSTRLDLLLLRYMS